MATHEIPYQEQARRGQEIYDSQIRVRLGADDLDKFVMIDVLTGDYEMGLNRAETALRLLERRPGAVIHAIRRHRADSIRIGGGASESRQ